MKLKIKSGEYYQLEKAEGITLFDDFSEAVKEMKESIKKGSNPQVKLWRVKQESGKWTMMEVSYQELFQMLVKEE